VYLEHHEPDSMDEALQLLARPHTVALAGGVFLGREDSSARAVVDLKKLGLNEIHHRGVHLVVGATVKLSQLVKNVNVLPEIGKAVQKEVAEDNLDKATIGGTLVVAEGLSPFATALLAVDARVHILPGSADTSIGDFLPFRKDFLVGRLITGISIPMKVGLALRSSRHHADNRPLVWVGVARWPSGRTRVALGGVGAAPVLAFDSPEDSGIDYAVEDAFSRAGDARASAKDRQAAAVQLANEGLAVLKSAA